MKRTYVSFLAFTSLLLPAQAALIAYESFNYTAGAVAGGNGGSGFSGAWTGVGGENPGNSTVETTGLSFSDLPVSGGLLQQAPTDNTASRVSRPFTASLTGTTYGSFLYRQTELGTGFDNSSVSGFHIGASNVNDNGSTVGIDSKAYQSSLGGVRTNGTFTGSSGGSQTIDLNTTYFVLFSATLNPSSQSITTWTLNAAQFDHFKIGGITEAELSGASAGTGNSNVWSTATRSATNGGQNTANLFLSTYEGYGGAFLTAQYDEIRLGTDFASVIPEPSSALLGLVGFAALLRRHRR